jgi:cyclic pyranopterin phosphate synthase
MPEEGIQLSEQSKILTTENISRIAEIFVGHLGTTKIRLTGGEPTVRRDLPEIIQSIKSHPQVESIGITTNGALLGRRLESYADAGLDVINVSLDSLVPAKNELITRRANTQKRAIEAIDKALEMNRFKAIKLNVVVMKGFNDDELLDFAEFVRDRRVELRFIEFMPFDKN